MHKILKLNGLMINPLIDTNLSSDIKQLIQAAKQRATATINA